MIVVIGSPFLAEDPSGPAAAGLAGRIATSVAAMGAAVQLAGRIGDDAAGDRLLLALSAAGVGHAAVLRDPARTTPVLRAPTDDGGEDRTVAAERSAATAAGDAELTAPIGRLAEAPPDDGPADTDEVAKSAPLAGPAMDAADVDLALRYLVDYRVLIVAAPLDTPAARAVADAAGFAGASVVAVGADPGVAEILGPATVLDAPAADPDDRFSALVAAFAVALDQGATADEAFRAALDRGGWEPAAT